MSEEYHFDKDTIGKWVLIAEEFEDDSDDNDNLYDEDEDDYELQCT